MPCWVYSVVNEEEIGPGSPDEYKLAHNSHCVDKPWQNDG